MKIKLEMPDEEQHKAASLVWYNTLKHCFWTRWPGPYKALSFRTEALELTKEDGKILLDCFNIGSAIEKVRGTPLRAKISDALLSFGSGAFIKLESRSPKDNWFGACINFRRCSWQDVIESLYSERILDDLIEYKYLDAEPMRMLFRQWHFMPKHEEFRCFIRNRKLVGISQYFYSIYNEADGEQQPFISKLLVRMAHPIESAIKKFIDDHIMPDLPADDLVVDLWFSRGSDMRLIEINPYGLSDPCLLNYQDMEKPDYYAFKYNGDDTCK